MAIDTSDKLKDLSTTLSEWTEQYFTDVFSPWETKEQLEVWREVKGDIKITKNSAVKNITQSAFTTVSYTGLWFTPKLLQANAYAASGANGSFSYWTYFNWITNAFNWYAWGTASIGWNIASVQSPTAFISASVVSLDSDWFTIQYTWSWAITMNLIVVAS